MRSKEARDGVAVPCCQPSAQQAWFGRSPGRRRRLTIEALEQRQLLAVDLSAYAVHRIVDNLSPAYTEAGSGWLGWSGSGAYQGDLRYVGAGTGQNTATFSLSDLDPAKTYQLFATWNESGAHASNTPFTVLDGGVALATVQLSQQAAPSEATLDGQNWQSLGVFHASTGTLNVRISDAANGSVVADAVCIVQIAPLTAWARKCYRYGLCPWHYRPFDSSVLTEGFSRARKT